jgi:thiol-disulfide isomerase/thioredoxin
VSDRLRSPKWIRRTAGPWCAAILALGLSAVARPQGSSHKSSPGAAKKSAPPDPVLLDLEGYRQMIAKFKGKPLVVNFWATWCEPCREEYPMLVELAKQYASQGVAVVGMDMDDDADMNLVRRFLARNQPGFPNFRQKPGIDLDAFYPGINPEWRGTMPETVFYGRDGQIVGSFAGTRPRPVFEQAFRVLLDTHAGRPAATGSTGSK